MNPLVIISWKFFGKPNIRIPFIRSAFCFSWQNLWNRLETRRWNSQYSPWTIHNRCEWSIKYLYGSNHCSIHDRTKEYHCLSTGISTQISTGRTRWRSRFAWNFADLERSISIGNRQWCEIYHWCQSFQWNRLGSRTYVCCLWCTGGQFLIENDHQSFGESEKKGRIKRHAWRRGRFRNSSIIEKDLWRTLVSSK